MSFTKDLKLSGLPEMAKSGLMEIYNGIQEIYRAISPFEQEETVIGEMHTTPNIPEYFSACPFREANRRYSR